MSSLVSEALMEATWQRLGGSSRPQMMRLQQACGKEQKELNNFVIAFASELSPDAMGLALYAHDVISEAFRRTGAKFRPVTAAKIMRAWESSTEMAASLREHGRSAAEQHAEFTSEPAVFRYILGAMEFDPSDPLILTDDEFWHILCILKTLSDCLHDARKDL